MIYRLYRALARLPLPAAYALAAVGAWLLEYVFRYRVKVVDTNLANALPEKSPQERRELRSRFYRHLSNAALEIIAAGRMPLSELASRVPVENPDLMREISDDYKQSVLVLTIHQGNWEWMLHGACAAFPVATAAIYKRQHSEDADRYSNEARRRSGSEPVEMRDAARNILKHRRTPRLVFIVADQSPGARERVEWTQFLNQPTAFFAGAASLARATGFPLVFGQCIVKSRGCYAIRLHEISRDPKSLSEAEIVERYAKLAERSIRESPEHWLWSNRRWKVKPPQEAAASGAAGTVDPVTSNQSNP